MDHDSNSTDRELGTFTSYFVAFIISLILSLGAYFVAMNHSFSKETIITFVSICAFVQVMVQFVIYLRLGIETRPRWNLIVFLFMVLVIVILLGGSLWIMHNLNYNMMPTLNPGMAHPTGM